MRFADEKQMEHSAVNADRHTKGDGDAGRANPPDLAQSPSHADRCTAGPQFVVDSVEEQQERITTELEEAGTVCIHDRK